MSVKQKDFAAILKDNIELYAQEVNEDRAIPSIYDGLKPSQRRILYWLSKNKGTNFLGCAEIVGGVLGSFHPHGDSSVYAALVRLSQPLIMNYNLIDFHGNNGSLTDVPAAMRYTKAKLSSYGMALLNDIDVPGAIEWQDNYNETQKEPKYLVGVLGSLNLLINPSIGIGVGLASNFTCHNVSDVMRVLKYRMEHPDCRFEDLPQLTPSFHNAGTLINLEDIPNIYKTGHGTVVLRAIYEWKDNYLWVKEFPYRVSATSVKKALIKNPVSGISEIYEQNGQLKIYIEPGTNKENLEKVLLKKTNLQMSYAVNMTATGFDGKPRVWTLLDILDAQIKLQHNRISVRAQHEKEQAEHHLHIAEGMAKALDKIDEVIAIIRAADSPVIAESNLCEALGIDNAQAKAILDLKLSRLTKMQINEVLAAIENYKKEIADCIDILTNASRRESIYFVEAGHLKDETPTTPCFSLIRTGGDKIDQPCNIMVLKDKFYTSFDDVDDNLVEDEYFEINPDDQCVILTNKMRAFLRKGSDIPVGEHKWKDLIPVAEDETVVTLDTKKQLENEVSYIVLTDKDGSEYYMHVSFFTIGASQRGKKITRLNYDIQSLRYTTVVPEGVEKIK